MSQDGKWALSGGDDNTVRLWDCQTGMQIHCFKGHTSYVPAVAFSPDSKWALSGSGDETVRVWDCQTGNELFAFHGHLGSVGEAAFSSDGKWAFATSPGQMKIWNLNRTINSKKSKVFTSTSYGLCISRDGKWALSENKNSTTNLWDCSSGKILCSFQGGYTAGDTHSSIAFSRDGKLILTGCKDHVVRLWDSQTGKEIRAFQGHTTHISGVDFSPDGKLALSGSWDKTVRLWDCQTGRELRQFLGHSDSINIVTFSPDGKRVLTGSNDKTVRLWDCQTGKELRCFAEDKYSSWVPNVAFSPDGTKVFLNTFWSWSSAIVRIWDCLTGKEVSYPKEYSCLLDVSSDGKWALSRISNSKEYNFIIWDFDTKKEIYRLTLPDNVIKLHILPDKKRIIVSTRLAIQMWELFDANNQIKPALIWSSESCYLSAKQLNMEGVKGLSESNQTVLVQHGAIK